MNCECNNNSNRVKPRIKHVYGNVLRMAIPLTLRTLVKDGDEMIVNDTDFIPSSDHLVRVVFSKGKTNYPITATMDGNVAIIEDKGKIPVGTYDISVECYDDLGNPYRFKQNAVLYVADTTAEAGIDEEIEYEAQTWYLNAAVFLATTEIGDIGNVIDAKLEDVFGNAVYDANAKEIRFYNKDNSRLLATIDSRPFIVDGTVADVYIDVSRQVLVVVLNEDAGGRMFSVPLYLVFNSYYKKDEVDSLVSSKVEGVRFDFSQELPLVVPVTKNGSSISSSLDFGSIDNAIHEDGRLVVACVNNAKFYQLSGVNGMEVVFSRVTALDGYQELLIVDESNVWSMEEVDLGTSGGGGYEPPVGGIPKTDLASDVQSSLDKADTALQQSDKTELQNEINNKVDAINGKGLSTNDFTDALLEKLNSLDPYTKAQTDDAIQEAVEGLGGGSVESVTINGQTKTPDSQGNVDLGTIQGAKGDKGDKGDTVVIDPEGLVQFEIANDLDTSDPTQGLSARQGKILKQAISTVQANLQAVVDALANMAFTSAKPTLSQIDWTGGTFYATIVKSLTGCTATDNTTNGQIVEGQTLTMTLTADSGFTLTGATISVTNSKGQSVAYTLNGSTLTVANVTGTITVSVVAVGVFSVVNNDTNVNLTANTMSPTSGSSWTGTLAVKSGVSNYRLASAPVVTMGGTAVDFTATGNSWDSSTGVMTIGNVTGNIVITSASVEMVAHKVANHFINMASTGEGYVEDGDDYTAVLSPTTGATSNGDLRVFVDGEPLESTDYTFDSATGALTIPAAKITGDVDVCATASTGKITVTVKAGMSTTVEFKQNEWASAFYSDTIDASESAEDVTVVIDTVPKANGIPTVSLWTFGTPAAIKSIDFGGCKTHGTSTFSKFSGLSGAESITGLALVRTGNSLNTLFKGCSSLKGTLDLMTWRCDNETSPYQVANGCTADEIILPYTPNVTNARNTLQNARIKRFTMNKTGAISVISNFAQDAPNLKFVDLSRANITSAVNNIEFFFGGTTPNGITLKIGEFDLSSVNYSPLHSINTKVSKLICTTMTPPNSALLNYLGSSVAIYVPNSAVDAYKTAWTSKASNIHPVSEYTE